MEVTHAMTGTVRRHHGWTGSSCHGDSAFYPDGERAGVGWCIGIDALAGQDLPDGTRVTITVTADVDPAAVFAPSWWHLNRRAPEGCTCERARMTA